MPRVTSIDANLFAVFHGDAPGSVFFFGAVCDHDTTRRAEKQKRGFFPPSC